MTPEPAGALYLVSTPIGNLELDLLGTWLNRFQTFSTVRASYGDNLAGRYGYSRLTASLSGALTSGAFENGIRLTYRSSTTLQGDYYDTSWSAEGCGARNLAGGDCRMGAYVRTDYSFSYTGIKNLTLSAHIRNLFNRPMALDRRFMDENVTPSVEDVQGRSVRLAVTYRFF